VKHKSWNSIRTALGYLGLVLPLVPVLFFRYRLWASIALITAGVAHFFLKGKAEAVRHAIGLTYLVVLLLFATANLPILISAAPTAPIRAVASAAALTLMFALTRKYDRWQRAFQKMGDPIGHIVGHLLLVLATVFVLRIGQWGLWPNPSIVTAVLIVFPVLLFRPKVVFLATYLLCAMFSLFSWHGYLHTAYSGEVDAEAPPGIQVEVLRHGNPTKVPCARLYAKGSCPMTKETVYIGEVPRTYRMDADKREVDFLATGLDQPEPILSIIELCERGLVVTGSEERRVIRIADLHTGEPIKDLALEGMPTTLVLSPDRKHVFASTNRPAGVVRIDLTTLEVDRRLEHFYDADPTFSGIINIHLVSNRIVGAYASFFTILAHPGEVFSVNLELDDYRTLMTFEGSYAYVAEDSSESVFLKVYDRADIWRVRLDGSGAGLWAEAPAGHHYLASMETPRLVLSNHWSTGELLAICRENPDRRFTVGLGGMGRTISVFGNQVLTPAASGYVTVTFDQGLCGTTGTSATGETSKAAGLASNRKIGNVVPSSS
jgi:hypothetical protein